MQQQLRCDTAMLLTPARGISDPTSFYAAASEISKGGMATTRGCDRQATSVAKSSGSGQANLRWLARFDLARQEPEYVR